MLRNSTNIPDGLVGVAIAHGMSGMPSETPPPDVVDIRNKRRERIAGQWGWWFPRQRRIIVYVPKWLQDYRGILKYTKKSILIQSRAEFLIAIMAHELRHCYQDHHWNTEKSKWKLAQDRLGKLAREVDAELWELKKLEEWRIRMNGNGK